MRDRRHFKRLLEAFAVLLILSILGCATASEITEVPEDALVVDVRTPREFADWHYPGAINIPVQVLEQNLSKLPDKGKPIIVYCRSGHRASTAKKILVSNNYKDIKNGGGLGDMKRFLP